MGRVGDRVRARVRLGSQVVVFWAAFDIFRLKILEARVGQTNFPDFCIFSCVVTQNCGGGGS